MTGEWLPIWEEKTSQEYVENSEWKILLFRPIFTGKGKNIRQNILAWLKRPDLGMVPLFMAGDKYFFYYTEQLKKQTGIDLNIWGIKQSGKY